MINMVKKTRSRRRYSNFKSVGRRYSKKMSPTNVIIGGVAYGVLEPTLNSMASRAGLGISDEILKFGVGYYLAKKSGTAQAVGVSMLSIASYKLAQGRFNLMGGVTANGEGDF